MKLLTKLGAVFDRIIGAGAYLAAILVLVIITGVACDVITRLLFNQPIFWMTDVILYSLLYITFLGGAWLLAKEKHVKMDIILTKFNPRVQAIINVITSVIGIAIFMILTWYSMKVTMENFQRGIIINSELGPPKFVILAIIPVGSFMLFIQFIRRAFSNLRSYKGS